jgi:aspartyl-tRNA synthetase
MFGFVIKRSTLVALMVDMLSCSSPEGAFSHLDPLECSSRYSYFSLNQHTQSYSKQILAHDLNYQGFFPTEFTIK